MSATVCWSSWHCPVLYTMKDASYNSGLSNLSWELWLKRQDCCLVPSCFNLKGNSRFGTFVHPSRVTCLIVVFGSWSFPMSPSKKSASPFVPWQGVLSHCPLFQVSVSCHNQICSRFHAQLPFDLVSGLLVPSSMWSVSYPRILQPVCFLTWLRS